MPQFFLDKKMSEGLEVEIRGAGAHHIVDVLRLKEGDWLVLSDGAGNSFRSIITCARSRAVKAKIKRKVHRHIGALPPTLAIASIRSERFEWAVQKCVELGCRHIMPFDSARTVRQSTGPRTTRKIERLERIAMEAAKQSGLPVVPAIDPPVDFKELCAKLSGFEPRILLYEGEQKRDLHAIWREHRLQGKEVSSKTPLIVIGPEGGFTPEEVELATSQGAIAASLGTQILRVETAAVAAMAICQYELGNMDTHENSA